MTLRAKLIFSFLFITLLMMVLVATQQFTSYRQNSLVQGMLNEHQISAQLGGLASAARQIRQHQQEYISDLQNPRMREAYAGQFNQASDEISQYFTRLKSLYIETGKTSALNKLAEWQSASQLYTDGFNQVNRKVIGGQIIDSDRARLAIKEFDRGYQNLHGSIANAVTQQYQVAAKKAEIITRFQQKATSLYVTVAAVCLFLALITAFWMPARVTRPLRNLTEAANRISKGQVNQKVVIGGSLEYIDLAKSIKRLQTATDGLLKRVKSQQASAKPESEAA